MTRTPDLEARIESFNQSMFAKEAGAQGLGWVSDLIKELTEQRAELLDALKRIAATKHLKTSELYGKKYNWEIAQEVIDKHEGKI